MHQDRLDLKDDQVQQAVPAEKANPEHLEFKVLLELVAQKEIQGEMDFRVPLEPTEEPVHVDHPDSKGLLDQLDPQAHQVPEVSKESKEILDHLVHAVHLATKAFKVQQVLAAMTALQDR